MSNLVIMKEQQAVTTSLQVAESFEKNHRDVLAAIDDLKEGVAENYADLFYDDTYIHPQNKQSYRIIFMNRDGFTLLAMGFTGKKALEFKLQYINAFNAMEKHIKNQLEIPKDPMDALRLMFQATEHTQEKVNQVDARVVQLEENIKLDPGEYTFIGKMISRKVYQVGKERAYSMNKKQTEALFKALNKEIAEITGVRTRTQLRQKDYEKVISFIEDWEPSKATSMLVKNYEQLEMEV